jgi:hypothetical protein
VRDPVLGVLALSEKWGVEANDTPRPPGQRPKKRAR